MAEKQAHTGEYCAHCACDVVAGVACCALPADDYPLTQNQAWKDFGSSLTALREQSGLTFPRLILVHGPDQSAFANLLRDALVAVANLSVALLPLTAEHGKNPASLDTDLKKHDKIILFASPAVAELVTEYPTLRPVWQTLGEGDKDRLHVILCNGDFVQTALKIIPGKFLIRSWSSLLDKPPCCVSFPRLDVLDLLASPSGSQGIGLLPDLIGLGTTEDEDARKQYAMLVQSLRASLQARWRVHAVRCHGAQTFLEHPLLSCVTKDSTFELKRRRGRAEARTSSSAEEKQVPLHEAITSIVADVAKVNVFFFSSAAETALGGIHIEQQLLRLKMPFLSIELSDYPSRAAARACVRQALARTAVQLESARQVSKLVILMKGYQHLEDTPNLFVSNSLATFDQVRVFVTCQASTFLHRGLDSAFLPDPTMPAYDELRVFDAAATTPFEQTQLQDIDKKEKEAFDARAERLSHEQTAGGVDPFSPDQQRAQCQLLELTEFLKRVSQTCWKVSDKLQPRPALFLSYAWAAGKAALTRQQRHLARISTDMRSVGCGAWLDIERMTGDIDQQMASNIANSTHALLIGTRRYVQRAGQATNVKKEFDAIVAARAAGTLGLVVLRFEDDAVENDDKEPTPAVPTAVADDKLVLDFRGIDNAEDYRQRITRGLLPRLLDLDKSDCATQYEAEVACLQRNWSLVVAKHLVAGVLADTLERLGVRTVLSKSYIEQHALPTATAPLSLRYSLFGAVEGRFLTTSAAQTCVVFGDPGSGKSLFVKVLLQRMLEPWLALRKKHTPAPPTPESAIPAWLPIWIPLSDHSGLERANNCVENALKTQYFLQDQDIAFLKTGLPALGARVLFILDGYDELGQGIKPNLAVTNGIDAWPGAKVLITSRPSHFEAEGQHATSFSTPHLPAANAFHTHYVSPFDRSDIGEYVRKLGPETEEKFEPLRRISGLMELLSNPFLLNLVVQAAEWLKRYNSVTRTDVYEAFTVSRFAKEEFRLEDVTAGECTTFARALAFTMFKRGDLRVAVDDIFLLNQTSVFKNKLLEACPLSRSAGHFRFEHKSLLEFFVASELWALAEDMQDSSQNSDEKKQAFETAWNSPFLLKDEGVMGFLLEKLLAVSRSSPKTAEGILASLQGLVRLSKEREDMHAAAAAAVTLLTRARVPIDSLRGVRIQGADLSGGLFDGADFTDADLRGVDLSQAYLSGAKFQGATLGGVRTGEFPRLSVDTAVTSISWNADGTLFVSGGRDGILRLFDAQTWQELDQKNQLGACDKMTCAFRPLGPSEDPLNQGVVAGTIATASSMGAVNRFELKSNDGEGDAASTPELTYAIRMEGSPEHGWVEVEALAFAHDKAATLIAAMHPGTTGCHVKSLHWDSRILPKRPQTHAKDNVKGIIGTVVKVVTCDPTNDKLVYCGTVIGSVVCWDRIGNKVCCRAKPFSEAVSAIAVDPSEKLAVGGVGGVVVMQTPSLEQPRTLPSTSRVMALLFHEKGTQLISGLADRTICIWDLDTSSILRTLRGHTGSVNCLALHPTQPLLLSGSDDHTMRLWELTVRKAQSTSADLIDAVRALSLDAGSGDALVCLRRNGRLEKWARDSNKLVASQTFDGSPFSAATLGAIHGRSVVLWCSEQDFACRVHPRKVGDGDVIELLGHKAQIRALAFNDVCIVTGSDDGTARVWDSRTGKSLQVLQCQGGSILSVALSPDGQTLAAGTSAHQLQVWSRTSASSNNEPADFAAICVQSGTMRGPVAAVCFRPDGSLVCVNGAGLVAFSKVAETEADGSACTFRRGGTLAPRAGGLIAMGTVLCLPDGVVVAGDTQGRVYLFDADGTEQGCTHGHTDSVRLVYDSVTTRLFSGGNDGCICSWQLTEHKGDEAKSTVTPLRMSWCSFSTGLRAQLANFAGTNGVSPVTKRVLESLGGFFDAWRLAVHSGAVVDMTTLLDKNDAKLDLQDALSRAARRGHLEAVRLLLDRGADVNHHSEALGNNTALMEAAQGGHVHVATLLLERNAELGATNNEGFAPLIFAVQYGNQGVVQLLLERKGDPDYSLGVSVDKTQRAGWSLLMYAAEEGHADVVRTLLAAGAHANNGSQNYTRPIFCAAEHGHAEIVTLLIEGKANPDQSTLTGWNPLMYACTNGHVATVDILLKAEVNTGEAVRNGNHTALYFAIQKGHVAIVNLLLDRMVSAKRFLFPIAGGGTPLTVAASHGQAKICELLLANGANPAKGNNDDWTPLMSAVANGFEDAARTLLKHPGIDIEQRQNRGFTALILAGQNGHTTAGRALLEAKADVNSCTAQGSSALTFAAMSGHADMVAVLLEHKAEVDHKDGRGCTPLFLAAYKGHGGAIDALMAAGADSELGPGKSPMCVAIDERNDDAIVALIRGGVSPLSKINIWTALRLVIRRGSEKAMRCLLAALPDDRRVELAQSEWNEMVELDMVGATPLIEAKADINFRNSSGKSALDNAVYLPDSDADTMQLLELGADVSTALLHCRTPQTARLLLQHKASVHVADKEGMTPLAHAVKKGKMDMVEFLLEAKADAAQTLGYMDFGGGETTRKIVSLLIEHKADVNANRVVASAQSAAVLVFAVRACDLALTKILLDGKADPNVHALELPCLVHALRVNSSESDDLVRMLVDAGADMDDAKGRVSPLPFATLSKKEASVALMVERKANPNLLISGVTTLGLACKFGGVDNVKLLLEAKATLAISKGGFSPLMMAAEGGFVDNVNVFVEQLSKGNDEIDVNAKADDGFTSLMLAACNGHVEAVKVLLQAGAERQHALTKDNAVVKQSMGSTALSMAEANGHTEIVALLKQE